MATIPESMLIAISTPYARAGVLWDQYKANFGNEEGNRPLSWKTPIRIMNPTVDSGIIEKIITGRS